MIDDDTAERLHAEFVERSQRGSEDEREAWRQAAQLLSTAATPQRYIVGVDPADTMPGGSDRATAVGDGLGVRPLGDVAEPYCRRCDLDEHRCHGCGTPLSHGVEVCADCEQDR